MDGFSLAMKGAATAAAHAGEDWKNEAYAAFVDFAMRHKGVPFLTEEVRFHSPGVPLPPDNRSWGWIARLAKKNGVVRSVGYGHATDPKVHSSINTLWQTIG